MIFYTLNVGNRWRVYNVLKSHFLGRVFLHVELKVVWSQISRVLRGFCVLEYLPKVDACRESHRIGCVTSGPA